METWRPSPDSQGPTTHRERQTRSRCRGLAGCAVAAPSQEKLMWQRKDPARRLRRPAKNNWPRGKKCIPRSTRFAGKRAKISRVLRRHFAAAESILLGTAQTRRGSQRIAQNSADAPPQIPTAPADGRSEKRDSTEKDRADSSKR